MPFSTQSTSQKGSQPPARQLHLLCHELRSSAASYTYVTSTGLFQQHLDLYSGLPTAASPVVPVITFDDGHISNYEIAAPLLAARDLSAHFFLTVGWIGTRPGFMDWPQVRALHQAGHTIGAHSWSHALLTHCSPAQLDIELTQARLTLEDHLGAAVTTMSLPGGRANRRVLAACRAAGYTRVYTSVPQIENSPIAFTVGRLNIRGNMQTAWLAQLFTPSSPQLARLSRAHRLKAATKSILGDRLYAFVWALANRKEPDADGLSEVQDANPSSSENPSA